MKITTSIKTEFGAVDFGKIPYPEKAFREVGYGVLSETDVDSVKVELIPIKKETIVEFHGQERKQ